MKHKMKAAQLMKTWRSCQKVPGGALFFSKLLGKLVPYTGSIPFKILLLEKGHCRVELKDCRKVRNHFDCIHAMALANLAELSSGLAVTTATPETYRAILVQFRIEYLKKARGFVTAESEFTWPEEYNEEHGEKSVEVKIFNLDQDCVCRAFATWKVSKIK